MIKKIYKNYRSLINNIISLGFFKLVDLIIPLLLFPYLVSVVGEYYYGIYAFAYTLVFYFLNLTQYGFSLSAVKTIALVKEDKDALNKVFNDVLNTKLVLTIVSLLLIALLIIAIPQFQENYLVFLFTSLILIGDSLTSSWFFQGIEKMQFITVINVIAKFSFVIMAFVFIKTEDQYIYIGLYQSIGYLLAGIFSCILVYKENIVFKFVPLKNIKNQIKTSFTSFLILITPTLYSSSSILMLGFFSSYKYVTFLEAGMKISGMFNTLNNILTSAFYPFINRNLNFKKTSIKILLFSGLLLSIIMFLMADFIVNIWLGNNGSNQVVNVIRILSLSPFVLSVVSAFGVNKLLVEGKNKLFLKATIIASIVGLLSGVFFISSFNLYGAAVTIIFARALYSFLTYKYATDKK